MPIYTYRAKKGSEEIVKGSISARTEKEAIENLSRTGCIPIFIKEEKEAASSVQSSCKLKGRVKSRYITIFSREMASLLRSGVSILSAIEIISEQSESQKLKQVLKNVYNEIKSGATFSSALAQYPRIFSNLYIAMIQAGENSGALPEALLRISDYRTKQEEIISHIRMVMVYPVLMGVVGLATIIFMFSFVMPRLVNLFANTGQELPLPTQLLINITNALQNWWYWVVLILAGAVLIFKRYTRTNSGRLFLSRLKLRLPVFGKFLLKAELGRFSRTLELLISNGIAIIKAIDIAIPVMENEILKDRFKKSLKDLAQGVSFGKSLKSSKILPLFMSNLLIVGEESGDIKGALNEVANSYERDVAEQVKIMGNLLEPVMILVMGLVVGFIVISMLLPIFEINV
ncbi:type II secretion system F family protein [Candidatus Omnitrophota bacterium]